MSPRALSATLPKITRPILDRGGRDYAALVSEWPLIVGPALAGSSVPEKLSRRRPGDERASIGGTLTIRVTSGAAMEFQHREPQIIERINAYLGHSAVHRLRLIHGPIRARGRGAGVNLPALTPSESAVIDSAVSRVDDDELRSRLARFGRAMTAGRRRRPMPEN